MLPRRAQSGFTVVELTIAIAILSIVLSMAFPMFSETIAVRRIQGTAQSLAAMLRTAQAEAVRRNRMVEVLFTTSTPSAANAVSATSTVATGARNWIARATNPTGAADYIGGMSLTGDLEAVSLTNGAVRSIGFTSTARPVDLSAGVANPAALAGPLVIRVTSSGTARAMCVAVATGGSVRVCDPSRPVGTGAACQPFLPAGAC